MPDSFHFLHLIGDKVFAEDQGAGIQLPVNESQKREGQWREWTKTISKD